MNVAIRGANQFGPLTEERVAAFERELGALLPDEYRAFLLRHNGGVPDREAFNVPGGERPFHCFFPLHDGPWDDSTPEGSQGFPLQAALADFRGEVGREDLLPVGKDLSGSYVCIGLTGEDRGRVLYYDHETEQTVPLAESLSAFLSGLQ